MGQWDNLAELPKPDVAGSIPVARSIFSFKALSMRSRWAFFNGLARRDPQYFKGAA